MHNLEQSPRTLLWVDVASSPERDAAKIEYLQKSTPISAKHGGKPLNKYKVNKTLGHNNALQLVALFSFPNAQAIDNLFSDPDYQKLIPIRTMAFSEIRYTILEQIEV